MLPNKFPMVPNSGTVQLMCYFVPVGYIKSSWNIMNSQRLGGTAERPHAAE